MGRQELHQPLKILCEKINTLTDAGNEICIVTRLDTDGIASGSIILTALSRLGSRCSLRTISALTSEIIQEVKSEAHDFCILLGLGSATVNVLQQYLGENWTIIDHEEFSNENTDRNYGDQIINAWNYGFNGAREICTGSMSYLLSTMLDKKNSDLSAIAVIAALGDRQDLGDKKTLTGINLEILKTAQSLSMINTELDLLLYNSETIPIHESIARTSSPYIHGLTWNVNNAYSLIKNTVIKIKDNGKWRVLPDFSPEEKNIIRDAIAKFIITSSNSSSIEVAEHLLGFSYRLTKEDNLGHLRDARDFANLLDACGRIGKAGLGVALCMGDRSITLTEASLLASSPSLYGRLVFVRALTQEDGGNSYSFSARKCVGNKSQLNMGALMSECSNSVGGRGGGNDSRAGCVIPSSKLEVFLSIVRNVISNSKDPESSNAST